MAVFRIPLRGRDGSLRSHALVDRDDAGLVSPHAWHMGARGYVISHTGGYLHRLLLGLATHEPRYGDHVNGDRLDNRRENLRIVTPCENAQNLTVAPRARSGHRGVYFDRRRDKWYAQVQVAGVVHHLGTFADVEAAARAAVAFRAEHMPCSPDARLAA